MTIIGVGNSFRGDDAAGLTAARRLRALRPELRVLERAGDLTQLFDSVTPDEDVVLIDAMSTGGATGTIVRLDASARPLPESDLRASTHAIGVATAIELARVLGRLPRSVVVYGIEGCCFEEGAAMSPEVASAAEDVVRRILANG